MLIANYTYLMRSFYPEKNTYSWTNYRRLANVSNGNAFDSLNRYISEPSIQPKDYALYYQTILHCMRISRELSDYNMEVEMQEKQTKFEVKNIDKVKGIIEMYQNIINRLHNINLGDNQEHNLLERLKHEKLNLKTNENQQIAIDNLFVELSLMIQDFDKLTLKLKDS